MPNKRISICLVRECSADSKKTPNRKFFRVPIDAQRKRNWLKSINRIDALENRPMSCYRVCEIHFEKTMFWAPNRLRKNAIPVVSLPAIIDKASKLRTKKQTRRKTGESGSETDSVSSISSSVNDKTCSKTDENENSDSENSNNELVINPEFKEEPELDINETNSEELPCSADKDGVESVIVLDDPATSSATVFTISEIDNEIGSRIETETYPPISVPFDSLVENDNCTSNSKTKENTELNTKLFDWAKKTAINSSNYNELLSILRESNIAVEIPCNINTLELDVASKSRKDIEHEISDEETLSTKTPVPVLAKILKTVDTIHNKVDNRHNQSMCLLSRELFNINSNVQRIFKLLNKDNSEPGGTVNGHLEALFPLRSKKDFAMLEVIVNTDAEAVQEMVQYIRNLVVDKNDASKVRVAFQGIFHDNLLNEFPGWTGFHGLGTYKFCTAVVFEAFKAFFSGLDAYIIFVKKEISRSKWRKYIVDQRKLKQNDVDEPANKKAAS